MFPKALRNKLGIVGNEVKDKQDRPEIL